MSKDPEVLCRRKVAILCLLFASLITTVSAEVFFIPSAPGIITRGDPFSVSGTGAVNGTIGIWIIGRDHFEVLTTAPDRQGNFSLTIKPSATDQFSSGQYAILVQDPGKSSMLEITGGTDTQGNLAIMNRGKIVSRIGARENLGEDVREVTAQILEASTLSGSDDSFIVEYFFVQKPAVFFDNLIPASGFRLPDQETGKRITIRGTTNVGTGDRLTTEIRLRNTNEIVTTKNIPIAAGNPMNTWTWDLESPGLPPGEYELIAGWSNGNISSRGSFTVGYPVPPPANPGKPPVPGQAPPVNDFTFPILVVCSLIVLAIVLYYAGRD